MKFRPLRVEGALEVTPNQFADDRGSFAEGFRMDHLAEQVGAFPDALLFAPEGGADFLHNGQFYRAWNRARDAAGVRAVVREHDLRHFYGSSLAALGHGIPQIKRALGHGTAAATLGYLHATGERDAAMADSLPLPTVAARPNVTDMSERRAAR